MGRVLIFLLVFASATKSEALECRKRTADYVSVLKRGIRDPQKKKRIIKEGLPWKQTVYFIELKDPKQPKAPTKNHFYRKEFLEMVAKYFEMKERSGSILITDEIATMTVAMWIHETSALYQNLDQAVRGGSYLAVAAKNYGGVKQRNELARFCETGGKPINIEAYCYFRNEVDFLKGFWSFLQRKPYEDIIRSLDRKNFDKSMTPQKFLCDLAESGYSEERSLYAKKVAEHYDEARRLVAWVKANCS